MRYLLCFAAAICCLSASRAWSEPPAVKHPAVVRVNVQDGNRMQSHGSGTLIETNFRHGLVITNWHVVRDAKGQIDVTFPGGHRSTASILRVDKDWDLAALAIWKPEGVEPVALAGEVPKIGHPLTIIGYGKGDYRSASGQCVKFVSPGNNLPFEMLELTAAARSGDSGGPILNEQGELAGVLFGSARGRTNGSHCDRVRKFVSSVHGKFMKLKPQAPVEVSGEQPAGETVVSTTVESS